MKNDRLEQRRSRNDLGFDAHRDIRFYAEMWNDSSWRFAKAGPEVFESHCREVKRTPSITGKHMRKNQSAARASHGK